MAVNLYMRESLALELGRLYRAWDWEELSFGELQPTNIFPNADVMVDVTYRGETFRIAYKRYDINKLFKNFPWIMKPIVLKEEITNKAGIAAFLASRYGLAIEERDVADGEVLKTEPGWHRLKISPQSLNYRTDLDYYVGEPAEPEITADKAWRLDGNVDSSVGGEPLTAQFDYVDFGGRKWATHNTPKLQPLGVSLRAKGDFTLRFKIVATVADDTDKWQGLFSSAAGDDVGQQIKITCNDAPNKWFAYTGSAAWSYNNAIATAFLPNTVNEITIRGINGGYEFYLNGLLYMKVAASVNQYDAWTHFGKAGQFMSDKILISDIEYWETAIDMPILQAQSTTTVVRMMHYNDHDWYYSAANTYGKNAVRINPAHLMYAMDFTPQAHVLKTLPSNLAPWVPAFSTTNATVLTALRNALQAVAPEYTWGINNTWVRHSLYSCWMMFNGKTKDFNDMTGKTSSSYGGYLSLPEEAKWMAGKVADESFDNVLCILLNSTANNEGTLRVPLLLHYNEV